MKAIIPVEEEPFLGSVEGFVGVSVEEFAPLLLAKVA